MSVALPLIRLLEAGVPSSGGRFSLRWERGCASSGVPSVVRAEGDFPGSGAGAEVGTPTPAEPAVLPLPPCSAPGITIAGWSLPTKHRAFVWKEPQ